MTVLDALGQKIEIYVKGCAEEPLIEEATFEDGRNVDVPESTVEYIYSTYADLLSEAAHNYQMGQAEDLADLKDER